jgi:hypothetical protein
MTSKPSPEHKPRMRITAGVRPVNNELTVGERVSIGRRDYEVTHIDPESDMVTLVSLDGVPMQVQLTRRYLEEN